MLLHTTEILPRVTTEFFQQSTERLIRFTLAVNTEQANQQTAKETKRNNVSRIETRVSFGIRFF